jgi:bifunctional non-homologous end joining protein LigD
MTLKRYREKRHFEVTPEPSGPDSASTRLSKATPVTRKQPTLEYVIQKHRATQLHYDFRLEWNGVLLSWAVPKGPSLDPAVKRLAMQVEDHPIDYADFEGVIPEGEYGGGTVMVWDQGTWTPDDPDVDSSLRKGELKFTLQGAKLKGSWVLVRTHGYGQRADRSWLLIKHRDLYAGTEDIATTQARSVTSKRLLAEIARAGGGDAEKAATGDPPVAKAPPTAKGVGAPRTKRAAAAATRKAPQRRR